MTPQPDRLMRKARPDDQGRIRLDPRRIYILPTRHGLLYGVASLLMLLGSLNYASNLGLIFTFLFISLGVIAILHTWRNLARLELRIGQAAPAFAGGQADVPLYLGGEGERERPDLRIRPGDGEELRVDLGGGGEQRLVLKVPAPRRGEHPLGRMKVSTRFPLGLLRAWSEVVSDSKILVYPRPSRPMPARSRPLFTRADGGDRGVGADDFVGLRSYRPGDPPRHLDWKALARERGLVTRQFGGDRAEELWLEWDALGGLDKEERLSRLCRMVLDAARDGRRFGLVLPGTRIAPAGGEGHKHRCLAALARFGD